MNRLYVPSILVTVPITVSITLRHREAIMHPVPNSLRSGGKNLFYCTRKRCFAQTESCREPYLFDYHSNRLATPPSPTRVLLHPCAILKLKQRVVALHQPATTSIVNVAIDTKSSSLCVCKLSFRVSKRFCMSKTQ